MSVIVTANLNIDNPEDPLIGMTGSFETDAELPEGTTNGHAVAAVLRIVEAHILSDIRREVREVMPLASDEIVDAIATQSARLALLHEVMHLPDPSGFADATVSQLGTE